MATIKQERATSSVSVNVNGYINRYINIGDKNESSEFFEKL